MGICSSAVCPRGSGSHQEKKDPASQKDWVKLFEIHGLLQLHSTTALTAYSGFDKILL